MYLKSILIPIQPKDCELISKHKKSVIITKRKPMLKMPFKCYIYQTKTKRRGYLWEYDTAIITSDGNVVNGAQKVIGEFVCDKIEHFYKPEELDGNHAKFGYAWHISNLKIYDKPKELSEFKKGCNDMDDPMYGSYCEYCENKCYLKRVPQSWCYVEEL